jgi:hypothetical protein
MTTLQHTHFGLLAALAIYLVCKGAPIEGALLGGVAVSGWVQAFSVARRRA